tara:strand:- start:115 stop:6048 length:5934 start_codon:yes stop_codon:yes gene_type:complete
MPNFEFEYTDQDFQIIGSQEDAFFSGTDYIRLTIYPAEAIDDIVTLPPNEGETELRQAVFYSTNWPTAYKINVSPFESRDSAISERLIGGDKNDFKIYKKSDESVYIKPNEIFNTFELPEGDYRIQIDFLNQVKPIVNPAQLDNQLFGSDGWLYSNYGELVRFAYIIAMESIYNDTSEFDEKFNQWLNGELIDDAITNFVIDYLTSEYGLPDSFSQPGEHYQFIIKQISTSRKEIRLKLLNEDILNNSQMIVDLTNEFNNFEPEFLDDGSDNPNYKYQFKHVLNIGTGDHIPIMNYTFDRVTDGKNNQSIILKLYENLPTNVSRLSFVTIEKEVLTTQIENTFYFSDVPDVYFGDGLLPDAQENWINPDGNELQFESFNELTSSLNDVTVDALISKSKYDYPNLQIDYNKFENHTFLGSAKRKLKNFKAKVETIQGYYSEISSSLSADGESIVSCSTFLKQKRQDLFKKVNDEIKKFSPYERFLYFDGQSESTASAPGLGKNYSDIPPVRTGVLNDYIGQINGGDGFDVVYHHSSQNTENKESHRFIDLFTNKYIVHEKPFFNYSSSLYLSFLMKGDSGSALTWENRNRADYGGGVRFPQDALYQNNILNPDMTGSKYQRYIFQASQSFWIPTTSVNFDLANLNDLDFNAGSTAVEVLHGGVKTGSNQIKDSSGKYQNYTTVVTQSGVPFYGSVMPSGELFRIFYENTLKTRLSGSWNLDSQTSGSLITNAMLTDFSGRENTGSIVAGSPKVAAGYLSGSNAFLFQSESKDEIKFKSDEFNFGKHDNFSLSVWAKRFHPNTGSADPAQGNKQPIFSRGQSNQAYGIFYDFENNEIDAGVVGKKSGSPELATHAMSDDLLDWHHLAFTFQSGSSTGIKLYVDGALQASSSTTGTTYSITGSSDFTSSAVKSAVEALSIGGDDTQGVQKAHWSGFIQYPRVYSRTITPAEINQLYLHPDGQTDTKITDVRLSTNDPTDVLPFDNLYHTSSANWINWYNDTYDSASKFDEENIHSFENNLPLYIQESEDYDDLKDFLSLQGEQYDVIRNHIDSLGTLHNRGYKKLNSPSNNSLPVLLQNIGWEAINPFSGSLSDTLGPYLNGITSIDDIKNNTWRKTLNNLLYIYKAKGTQNAVRALLNVYGYPPDILSFKEFGGSTEDLVGDDNLIPDDAPDDKIKDLDLDEEDNVYNFKTSKNKLYRWIFANKKERILNLDWWMDDANINSFEFVYKHSQLTNTQTILKSSGSAAQHLWDLRLIPDDGDGTAFEFRLNNSQRGGTGIGSRGFSMSSAYVKRTDGQLWNVMIQRMTGSIVNEGTQEYRLHTALQDKKQITNYGIVSMSISGGKVGDSTLGGKGFFANENFVGSGSRHPLSSSNLFVGIDMSGSLSQIKAWNSALSTSKFRQHTLNKFSVVGNTSNAQCKELIYHFKLAENYTTSSVSSSNQMFKVIDSAPKTHLSRNYSFNVSGDLFTGSLVYGFDLIDVVQLSLQDSFAKENDSNVLINPNQNANIYDNLNPFTNPIEPLIGSIGYQDKMTTSPRLEIYRSPQDFVDNFILDSHDGQNFEQYYGNPIYYHSSSYTEFDDFREDFFLCNPITVDTNKFIRAHENMFNYSITEGLKKIIPGRSTFDSNVGVEIRPTLLEKQKYENEHKSVEVVLPSATGSVDVNISFTDSVLESTKTGSINISSVRKRTLDSGSNFLRFDDSGGITLSGSSIVSPYTGSTSPSPSITNTIVNPYTGSVNIISIRKRVLSGSGEFLRFDNSEGISLSDSTVVFPKSGTVNYSAHSNKSFENVHDNWATSSNATHFINYAGGTGSYGNYNTYHIDTRFVFHMIGDTEIYSGSKNLSTEGNTDYTNPSRFYNRTMLTNNIHKNVTYESFINGNPGLQTGRMMGKTRYFFTGSDGNIILPANHISRYDVGNHWLERMKQGTQNTNPGFLNVKQEDYSTASFYRVKVTGGENQIIVRVPDKDDFVPPPPPPPPIN